MKWSFNLDNWLLCSQMLKLNFYSVMSLCPPPSNTLTENPTLQAEKQRCALRTVSVSLPCALVMQCIQMLLLIREWNSQILAGFQSRNSWNTIWSSWSGLLTIQWFENGEGLKITYFSCKEGHFQNLSAKKYLKKYIHRSGD